jgi:hypothetical protein
MGETVALFQVKTAVIIVFVAVSYRSPPASPVILSGFLYNF